MRANNHGSCYSHIRTALTARDQYLPVWQASVFTSLREAVGLTAAAVSAVFAADRQLQQISSIANDAAALPAPVRLCEATLAGQCVHS